MLINIRTLVTVNTNRVPQIFYVNVWRAELGGVRRGALPAHHHPTAAGPQGQPRDDHRGTHVHTGTSTVL